MDEIKKFQKEVADRVESNASDDPLNQAAEQFLTESIRAKYSYNFSWLGRPIIQYPQDIVAMQELIWSLQPDLIVETGIAHGGSVVFSASMLELNAACGGPQDAKVIGIDVDIRQHNKELIEAHPMSRRIEMIEGSSVDESVVEKVKQYCKGKSKVLVCLDSNHTHEHVLQELEAYSDLVTVNSYCVVFDTVVANLPADYYEDRPWSKDDNPMTAMDEFLLKNSNFVVDEHFDNKLLVSVAPRGYLKRVS